MASAPVKGTIALLGWGFSSAAVGGGTLAAAAGGYLPYEEAAEFTQALRAYLEQEAGPEWIELSRLIAWLGWSLGMAWNPLTLRWGHGLTSLVVRMSGNGAPPPEQTQGGPGRHHSPAPETKQI